MGTTYYLKIGTSCPTCDQEIEPDLEIGRASAGWKFVFKETDDIKTKKDWFELLNQNPNKIFDEYNKSIAIDDFKKIVEERHKNKNLSSMANEHPSIVYSDHEGFEFEKI